MKSDARSNVVRTERGHRPAMERLEVRRLFAAVVGRHVFYNDCAFDGHSIAAEGADDAAIDATKSELQPGQAATFANVTSYSKGLNGVMIDMTGLPVFSSLSVEDFAFRTGRSNDLSAWSAGPGPRELEVRRGAGVGGSDRVSLTWDSHSAAPGANRAVANAWLEITVRSTADTGLAMADVFYFGNLIGETGTGGGPPLVINAIDMGLARAQTGQSAGVDHPADFNRDGVVNTTDVLIVRDNIFNTLPIVTPPPRLMSPVLRIPSMAEDLFG